jgi:cell division protease FtsH
LNDLAKNIVLWIVIAVVLLTVFNSFGTAPRQVQDIPYSTFLQRVDDGSVSEVVFEGDKIVGAFSSGERFTTYSPETDNRALIGELKNAGVNFRSSPPQRQSFLMQLFISSFPILLLIAVWVYFMRQMQGGGGGRGAMSFGKSRPGCSARTRSTSPSRTSRASRRPRKKSARSSTSSRTRPSSSASAARFPRAC